LGKAGATEEDAAIIAAKSPGGVSEDTIAMAPGSSLSNVAMHLGEDPLGLGLQR